MYADSQTISVRFRFSKKKVTMITQVEKLIDETLIITKRVDERFPKLSQKLLKLWKFIDI